MKGDGSGFQPDGTTGFDAIGRVVTRTDVDDKISKITYTPATGQAFSVTEDGAGHRTGGTMVAKLGVLREGAAEHWSRMRDAGEVPMPVVEVPVPQALADLAGALRTTDMYWPRHDDEDFVEVRALAWSRCREFLPD